MCLSTHRIRAQSHLKQAVPAALLSSHPKFFGFRAWDGRFPLSLNEMFHAGHALLRRCSSRRAEGAAARIAARRRSFPTLDHGLDSGAKIVGSIGHSANGWCQPRKTEIDTNQGRLPQYDSTRLQNQQQPPSLARCDNLAWRCNSAEEHQLVVLCIQGPLVPG